MVWSKYKNKTNEREWIKMAKIKQIGGKPNEVPAMTKDILVWLKCLEGKNHPT